MPAPDFAAHRGGPPPWAVGGAGPGGPQFRMPRWVGLWLPVILSALVQIPSAAFVAFVLWRSPLWAIGVVALAVAGPAALIAARRAPGTVAIVVGLLAAADVLLGRPGPPYLAVLFAIVGAIVRGARVPGWIAAGLVWSAVVTAGVIIREPVAVAPWRIAGTTLGLLAIVGIAEAVRSRRARAGEFRRRLAERRRTAQQEERVRIARELHDVLGHSLSSISVQAGVGLHLMDRDPEQARAALTAIRDASRAALDEVRGVLGVLRSDDTDAPLVPEPGLDRLPALVEGAATATLATHLVVDERIDPTALPAPVQLAAYRIVQESLTNIGRHAPDATSVRVGIDATGTGIRITVLDDGGAPTDAAPSASAAAPGNGLIGMRERATLLGGSLVAGPDADGWRVVAELPAPPSAATASPPATPPAPAPAPDPTGTP